MGFPASILKLASKVEAELGGVNWAELEVKLNIPREEVVYHTGAEVSDSGAFMYWHYIDVAYLRAKQALTDNQIVLSWDVTDNPATEENEVVLASKAWDAIQRETVDVAGVTMGAIEQGVSFLDPSKAMLVDREKLRAMVSSIFMVSLYGSVAHKQVVMQHANVAPEDIIESADEIVKSFNAITRLVEVGALNPLRKETATAGLGLAPGVIVTIAVLAVVAICIIAWCIVATTKQIKVNKAIEQMCTEAARTGSEKDKERCSALVEMNLTATEGGPSIPPLGDLKNMVIASAVIAGLVILGPPLVKAFERRPAT